MPPLRGTAPTAVLFQRILFLGGTCDSPCAEAFSLQDSDRIGRVGVLAGSWPRGHRQSRRPIHVSPRRPAHGPAPRRTVRDPPERTMNYPTYERIAAQTSSPAHGNGGRRAATTLRRAPAPTVLSRPPRGIATAGLL